MRKSIIAASACVAIVTAGAALAKRDRNVPPEAIQIGKAQSCIPLTQIRETRVYGDRTIDFRISGKKVYRNTLPHDCPSLGFEERFSYATSLSQLCSTDIITVLYSQGSGLSRGASCGLGEFQPVEIVKKPR